MPKGLDKNLFKNKKVLVFGLGLLGGGVATTNWLLKHGARVTVTDLKNKKQLTPSLKQIKGSVKLRIDGHDEKDIEQNDIIVFNPDIPVTSKYVNLARKLEKQVENEATIFYKLCGKPVIAVTGTRGKTTTANWLSHLLNPEIKAIVSGNSYIEPLLKTLDRIRGYDGVVNETPSYHLEFFDETIKPPETAIITNIFQDHLNRHTSFEGYAATKANVFGNQTSRQNLILNYDNGWTKFLLAQKPRSKVWFFSEKSLPQKLSGIFCKRGHINFQSGGKTNAVLNIRGFAEKWGGHNLQNLLAASLAAHLNGISWTAIQKKIKTLPQIPFRQEIIFQNKKLTIINDTAATSPDGGIAAVRRFGSPFCILITGGTDRQLDYKKWGQIVSKYVKPENIAMLAGSATDKMLKSLNKPVKKENIFDTLEDCFAFALKRAGKYPKSVILFSPAAKSFEKFKNEFDRGQKFNNLVKNILGGVA